MLQQKRIRLEEMSTDLKCKCKKKKKVKMIRTYKMRKVICRKENDWNNEKGIWEGES